MLWLRHSTPDQSMKSTKSTCVHIKFQYQNQQFQPTPNWLSKNYSNLNLVSKFKYPSFRFQFFQSNFPQFPSNQTKKTETESKYSNITFPHIGSQKPWEKKRKMEESGNWISKVESPPFGFQVLSIIIPPFSQQPNKVRMLTLKYIGSPES